MASPPLVHNSFSAKVNESAGVLEMSLVKDGATLGTVSIPTREASQIAAVVLGVVRAAYDISGKPPPNYPRDEPVSLTMVAPSGFGIGQGRRPDRVMLHFYFGDTALGLELPNAEAHTFAEQLMLSTAPKGARQ